MKKVFAIASLVGGLSIFAAVLGLSGVDSIIAPFRRFSLSHLLLFLAVTFLLHLVTALRWAVIVRHQGFRVSFLTLLKFRIIGSAISYITPAARIGGEPVRAYLLKSRLGIRGRHAFSSTMIDISLGMSTDGLFISVILLAMLAFFTLPAGLAGIALPVSLLTIIILAAFYSTLVTRLGPFSSVVRLFCHVFGIWPLKPILKKVIIIEDAMAEFFHFRKKGVVLAIFVSMLSWPITFLQYKLALLSIGFDASLTIILLSIIATAVAGVIPIPAAFGVQEAGHFSVFGLVASSSVGIALSLLIRLKDVLTALLGLLLLSHEGLGLLEVLKHQKRHSQ